MPCCAGSPILQNLEHQGSLQIAFNPVICNGLICLLWGRFGPCIVHGLVWGCLRSDQAFARAAVTVHHWVLSVLSSEWLLLVSGSCTGTRCLSPADFCSCSVIGVCGFPPLSPGQESVWWGAGLSQGCLDAAKLGVLWCCGWTAAEGVLEGVGAQGLGGTRS